MKKLLKKMVKLVKPAEANRKKRKSQSIMLTD